jgi:cytochrome P450
VPFGFRVAEREVSVAGHTIPAGTAVTHLHAVTHRMDEWYEDPFAFVPDRFVGRQPEPWSHGTFGGGRHVCIGQPLARLEAQLVVGSVLSSRRIELAVPMSTDAMFDGVLTFRQRRVPARFLSR